MVSEREEEEEEEEEKRRRKTEGAEEKKGLGRFLVDRERVERKHYYGPLPLPPSPLTRKKGPDPGWTELGRACRRGAGQGQGHVDGLGTGQEGT